MGRYVLDFRDIDQTQVAVVGGKGAALGELSRLDGVRVPAGFCVTTHAYQRVIGDAPSVGDQLDRLSRLKPEHREAIRALSAEVRRTIEEIVMPDGLEQAIMRSLAGMGQHAAYAVRSSATAEDLPAASFAGQQDTYLNVVGTAAVLRHISRCWASLFTERAVTYRMRNGVDHRKVQMAVAVQQMVFSQAAGILFTADPVTSNRKVASVEATFGLGEALASGLVNADVFKVRNGEIIAGTVVDKEVAVRALPGGGTEQRKIDTDRRQQPALTDGQVVRLVQLGRRIETHFGHPQDIEWCLVNDGFQIVQSRPITTLFPIPEADDQENHVYVSVGHQQMMTDAMKPLGLSFWQLTTPRPMAAAGGRLFVDVTRGLAAHRSGSTPVEARMIDVLGRSDPLFKDALQTILERSNFILPSADESPHEPAPGAAQVVAAPEPIETDPAIVTELIEHNQASVTALKREIRTKSGLALLDFIVEDIQELKRLLFDPRSTQVFMTAITATSWLNEHLQEWLDEKNAADTLTQSAPNNVTSEMGLALLDVADAIRPFPDLVAFLGHVEDQDFLDELPTLSGGRQARDAIQAFLDTYGMRCPGEIDITRPRFSEQPATLVPIILANINNFEPGAGERRFQQGRQEAYAKGLELLERLRTLADGEQKAAATKAMIDRVRTFIGYREYPKYGVVSRYFIYKQALMQEAQQLVQAGAISEKEDIFYLTFQELRNLVRTNQADNELIRERKDAFRSHQALTPPRVLTSDGEAINGTYRRDNLPAGALAGLPVSAGTVEGRARVILDISQADLEAGDILVTTYTDPSWTPLFLTINGLVTEVGGLMTHGSVIAREYGLPAIVGVQNATNLIQDRRRIRVNGTDGYIEILP